MIQYSQPPCQDHEIWYYPHELWIHNVQRVQSLKLDPTAVTEIRPHCSKYIHKCHTTFARWISTAKYQGQTGVFPVDYGTIS